MARQKRAATEGDTVTFTVRVKKEVHRKLWELSVATGDTGKRKPLQAIVEEALEGYVKKAKK